jgi:anti-sigma factor RsiW
MMDGAHPHELDLLAFVEDELPDPRKAAVVEHLAVCAACAESVRQLETGRYALRSAPLLELPDERRAAALTGLPARPVRTGWSWRPRLVVPALATAAVVAVAVGVVLTGDFDRDQSEEAAKATLTAEEGAGQDQAAAAPEEAATTDMSRALSGDQVASVEGPPAEVARLLRRRGFDAYVADKAVGVRDADPDAVRRALVGRPAGPVPVIVP